MKPLSQQDVMISEERSLSAHAKYRYVKINGRIIVSLFHMTFQSVEVGHHSCFVSTQPICIIFEYTSSLLKINTNLILVLYSTDVRYHIKFMYRKMKWHFYELL